MGARTGCAETMAWLFRQCCELNDLWPSWKEPETVGRILFECSKYLIKRAVCFAVVRYAKSPTDTSRVVFIPMARLVDVISCSVFSFVSSMGPESVSSFRGHSIECAHVYSDVTWCVHPTSLHHFSRPRRTVRVHDYASTRVIIRAFSVDTLPSISLFLVTT